MRECRIVICLKCENKYDFYELLECDNCGSDEIKDE